MKPQCRSVRFPLVPLRAALWLILLLCIGGPPRAAAQAGRPVAIVVNPRTRVDNLSFSELRRIFMGEQQFWADRSKVTLLVRAPTAYERDVVLNRIYRMDEDRFRQYWIAKMFRAEVAAGPKLVYSSDMAINLIAAIPGAITFVPASAVMAGVKVVRVDGKLPGDAGYPLR
jgi:ABC-type phosphate transport system substrate-binding protein